jgi:hypothetical protein
MSAADDTLLHILHLRDALVALDYLHTRRNPTTGEREFQFDYEKCVAAAGGDAHVPEFLARVAEEYLAREDAR